MNEITTPGSGDLKEMLNLMQEEYKRNNEKLKEQIKKLEKITELMNNN